MTETIVYIILIRKLVNELELRVHEKVVTTNDAFIDFFTIPRTHEIYLYLYQKQILLSTGYIKGVN